MIPYLVQTATAQTFVHTYISDNQLSDEVIVLQVKANEQKELGIGQIREIQSELRFASSRARLFVLHGFDGATEEAQNALLKSLEQHEPNVHFILLCENYHQVLPTIRSRCRLVLESNPPPIGETIHTSGVSSTLLPTTNTIAEAKQYLDSLIMRAQKTMRESLDTAPMHRLVELRHHLINNQVTPQYIIDLASLESGFDMK